MGNSYSRGFARVEADFGRSCAAAFKSKPFLYSRDFSQLSLCLGRHDRRVRRLVSHLCTLAWWAGVPIKQGGAI